MMRPLAVLPAIGLALAVGTLWLFGAQFEAGGAYPPYSSYRRDAAGTRVLYDSLSSLAGIAVERNEKPLEWLMAKDATILVLGAPLQNAEEAQEKFAKDIESLAAGGNRVVVAFDRPEGEESDQSGKSGKSGKPRDKPRALVLDKRWGIDLENTNAKNEKAFGAGQVVVLSDATLFRNHSLTESWSPRLMADYLGDHGRIIFDESHLGLVESGSIVGLARRYRLHGFAFGAAIVVALYLWRSTSAFPAPEAAAQRHFAGRSSAAGLTALLGQNIAPRNLVSVAWSAWLKGKPMVPVSRRSQAEQIAGGAEPDPLQALARIHAVLVPARKPKGT